MSFLTPLITHSSLLVVVFPMGFEPIASRSLNPSGLPVAYGNLTFPVESKDFSLDLSK